MVVNTRSAASGRMSFNAGTFAPKRFSRKTTEYPSETVILHKFWSGSHFMCQTRQIMDNEGREIEVALELTETFT